MFVSQLLMLAALAQLNDDWRKITPKEEILSYDASMYKKYHMNLSPKAFALQVFEDYGGVRSRSINFQQMGVIPGRKIRISGYYLYSTLSRSEMEFHVHELKEHSFTGTSYIARNYEKSLAEVTFSFPNLKKQYPIWQKFNVIIEVPKKAVGIDCEFAFGYRAQVFNSLCFIDDLKIEYIDGTAAP